MITYPYFSSGDLDFFWPEQIRALSWLPKIFNLDRRFGYSSLLSLWLDYPFRIVVKSLSTIGLSWFIIEKLLWLSIFVVAIYSSFKLVKNILNNPVAAALGAIIYSFNTYILLLFGGGQLGVALAFGFAPLVLLTFMEVIDVPSQLNLRRSVINGIYLTFLISCDLRLAYLILGAIGLYWLHRVARDGLRVTANQILFAFIIPFLTAGLLHSFWILPTALASSGPASKGADFINPGMLKFLSVADFSHVLSLLHPNWPENLFGKIYFLQPEFLVLPILAFASLLFICGTSDKRQATRDKRILFFALLAIVGAFFAKGTQEPFGILYQWMFSYVPGFVMFRDPTKFYLYIALGYSILIPYTVQRLGEDITKYLKKYSLSMIHNSLFIILVIFWLFTIRAVFLGQVNGNFKPLRLTDDYIRLKEALVNDTKPSRTLWIPAQDKFAFYSDTHPLITANELFHNASMSALIAMIDKPSFMKSLSDAGIGYVIVPQDLEQRIFLKDYTCDPSQRNALIHSLDKITLTRDTNFTGLAVYTNSQYDFRITVPPAVVRQQQLANIGFIISFITFAGVICSTFFLR